jgi:hypothetical protein
MAEAFLTTQPGWAFATLRELRVRGETSRAVFYHRDSTLLLHGDAPSDLRTPAEVCGFLATGYRAGATDATAGLIRSLTKPGLRDRILALLPQADRAKLRRYRLSTEVWGRTSLQRNQLADAVRVSIERSLPRWQETTGAGLHIVCKADPQAALLGVQLYANLEASSGRPGSLRRHLAASLLMLAGATDGDCVLDPFAGSGTILKEAYHSFRNVTCFGADIDSEAVSEARAALGSHATVIHSSFDALDLATLPERLRLVANLPFGARFDRVPTARLLRFLEAIASRCDGIALLMSRTQARQIASRLGLDLHNVLVLGQRASIVHRG